MPNHPRMITAHGRTLPLSAWATETGLSANTITSRIDRLGHTPEEALSRPADRRFARGGRPQRGVPRAVPTLRKDNHGRAICRWKAHGRDHWRTFGPWASDEAAREYRRFAAEWAAGQYDYGGTAPDGGVSVAALVLKWLDWVQGEYVKLGRITSEVHLCRAAALALVELYGDTPAADFLPANLRTVRQQWVRQGKKRNTVNGYAGRVVRCFGWGVGQSLVPPGVHQALVRVEHLRPGRTEAPEGKKVRAVGDDAIAAALAKLKDDGRGRVVRAMVAVQRLTGMRPQHLCGIRPADLDRSGPIWVYAPPAAAQKTHHVGKAPRFYLGPRAQAELSTLLAGCREYERLFGYVKGKRRYTITVDAYCKTIRDACDRAGIPRWHPHQLRHALATEVAGRTESLALAAAAIGDTEKTAAKHYVHLDPQERARREIAAEMG